MLTKIAVGLTAACTMTLAAPVAAHAEPTGQYSYICILTSGSSYTLKSGAALNTCKGSYLKKYINGNQVDSINLTADGSKAKKVSKNFIGCTISIYGTGKAAYSLVKSKGTDKFAWVSLGTSITGLPKCFA
jgi:hypothetical protein